MRQFRLGWRQACVLSSGRVNGSGRPSDNGVACVDQRHRRTLLLPHRRLRLQLGGVARRPVQPGGPRLQQEQDDVPERPGHRWRMRQFRLGWRQACVLSGLTAKCP